MELEWNAPLPDVHEYRAAIDAVAEIGDGWRLPTADELLAIYPDAGMKPDWYWTGDADETDPESHIKIVSFASGNVGSAAISTDGAYLRAVRSTPP